MEAERVQAGGSLEPARGYGRQVPSYMPTGISFFVADPAHGEPYPVYDHHTRLLGRWMSGIGMVSALAWLGVGLLA